MVDGWKSIFPNGFNIQLIKNHYNAKTKYKFEVFSFRRKKVRRNKVDLIDRSSIYEKKFNFSVKSKTLRRRFIRSYIYHYIIVVTEELLKGNYVEIGRGLFILSLYTKKRAISYYRKDIKKNISYIRIDGKLDVHHTEKFIKKHNDRKYRGVLNRKFLKRIRPLLKGFNFIKYNG